jgi:C1A family cysteine protease
MKIVKMNIMKKNMFLGAAVVLIFGWFSCQTYLDFDPTSVVNSDGVSDSGDDGNNDGNNGGGNGGGNDGGLTSEVSEDDPLQTGSCNDSGTRNLTDIELIELLEIPSDLPEAYDLSDLMPPVRSQGEQASCVPWASTYYLKSYQEKIQYGYEYETFEDVMSPAFIYNQLANGNCGGGSTMVAVLDVLQTQGVTSWESFPYDDETCLEQPTEEQLEVAKKNRIGDYFIVDIPDVVPNPEYTKINLIKTLLSQEHPILMIFSIKEVNFFYQNNEENDFIGLTFTPDPTVTCDHAVLIVGYDDNLKAFKFVNSWGTAWGNEGYAWLSYNFFLPLEDPDYVEGVSGTYIAYDLVEDEI